MAKRAKIDYCEKQVTYEDTHNRGFVLTDARTGKRIPAARSWAGALAQHHNPSIKKTRR